MRLFDDLKALEIKKQKYQETLLSKIKRFKKIMLWGLSESATSAIEYFNKNNIKIDGIYDNDISKNNTKYMNINVIMPDDNILDSKTALIITCSYYETLRNKLLKTDKLIDQRLFMFDGYFLEDKDTSYYLDNQEKIEKCFNELADKESKELYEALLKYRYIRDISILKNKCKSRENCYLDEIFLSKFKKGLYIDVGSYNADFITTLSEKKELSECEFYIFEPNKIFSNKIKQQLKNKFNFKVFQIALGDEQKNMEFQILDSSTSHLIDKKYNAYKNTLENKIDIVEVNTLDNIVKEKKVTGIKIDIEGSEMPMLMGAATTIKRDKPILLISVYHRWNDLWDIENFISNLNLGYKFYLRHYSLSVAKTILYCIPEK